MRVDPEYAAVGALFQNQPMFRVPKYQRGYAWEKDEIEDFLNDLERLFKFRKNRHPKNHFLGGIVSVEHKVVGGVSKHSYELVDGQQRIATFVLLAASIIRNYEKTLEAAQKQNDTKNEEIIEKRLTKLISRFIEFEQEINRNTTIQSVIKLSKADDLFFTELVRNRKSVPQRDSHERLLDAFSKINKKVTRLTEDNDLNKYLDNLEIIEQNIDEDFSILHIVTYDQREAYTLFQVLNDRGKSLTEGDLLRAKTLEMLEGHPHQQNSVEEYWDNILSDPPRDTEAYLRWIYASHKGLRPGTSTLFDDFLKEFYTQQALSSISAKDADNIFTQTQEVQKEINNCRKLIKGEWVFPFGQPVTAWDRSRLSLLVNELKNTNSMPLLLAACKLDHKKFAEIVAMFERFMFRYVIICNQHHMSILDIIQMESTEIRKNPSGYTLQNLKNKLQHLLDTKANDSFFKSSLDTLIYREANGNNKALKYFLITLEDYWRWYREDGATGEPVCKDKSRVYTFADTTIEHIYPQNARGTVVDINMEDLKNTIGNLTILGPSDNVTGGNDDFLTKRLIYKQSTSQMNLEIADLTQWDRTSVVTRTNELKEIAAKVFKIK